MKSSGKYNLMSLPKSFSYHLLAINLINTIIITLLAEVHAQIENCKAWAEVPIVSRITKAKDSKVKRLDQQKYKDEKGPLLAGYIMVQCKIIMDIIACQKILD